MEDGARACGAAALEFCTGDGGGAGGVFSEACFFGAFGQMGECGLSAALLGEELEEGGGADAGRAQEADPCDTVIFRGGCEWGG